MRILFQSLAILLAPTLILAVARALGEDRLPGALLLVSAALHIASLWVLTAAHELGHAVAARLVGYRVLAIQLGIGRYIFRSRVAGVDIDICALPTVGLTFTSPPADRVSRLRSSVMLAGGPLVNGVLLLILPLDTDVLGELVGGSAVHPLDILGWTNAWLLLLALLPVRLHTGAGVIGTDMLQLLGLPFVTRAKLEETAIAGLLYEVGKRRERGEYRQALELVRQHQGGVGHDALRSHEGVILLDLGELTAALEIFRELRVQIEEPLSRALMDNNIAWTLLFLPDSDPLEIDARSRLALTLLPGMAAVQGTRGAALVRLGDPASAEPLLRHALALNSAHEARAHNAAWLSMALRALHKEREARKMGDLARRLDPRCYSLPLLDEKPPGGDWTGRSWVERQ